MPQRNLKKKIVLNGFLCIKLEIWDKCIKCEINESLDQKKFSDGFVDVENKECSLQDQRWAESEGNLRKNIFK